MADNQLLGFRSDPFAFTNQAVQSQQNLINQNLQNQQNLNRVNDFGPFGHSVFTTGPNGQVSRETQLAPLQAGQLDFDNALKLQRGQLSNDLFSRAQNNLSNPLDFSGLPASPVVNEAERNRIEQSLFNRFQRPLNQQFDRDFNKLEQRLGERGIPVGSQLFNDQIQQFRENKQNALQDALSRSIELAGNEQLNQFNLAERARASAKNDLLQQRLSPLSELGSVFASVPGGINFQQPAGFSALDVQTPNFLSALGGFSSLANTGVENALKRQFTASENDKNRALKRALDHHTDPFALLQAKTEAQKDLAAFQAGLSQQFKPKNISPFAAIGSGIAGGIGQGLGQGLGNSIAGLFG